MAAPRVRGLHGLPGRPWFGRALVDYASWAAQSGYSSRRARERNGAGSV